MKKTLLLTALLIAMIPCMGQIYSTADFTETAFPKENSEAWLKLDYSLNRFAVQIVNGELQISKQERPSNRFEFKYAQGKFIGDDEGEFGGGLYYQPDDTTKKELYINGKPDVITNNILKNKVTFKGTPLTRLIRNLHLIAYGNIKTLFSYRSELYYMEGLAHMGINSGAIYQIKIKGDSLSCSKVIDFDNAPDVITTYKNRLYVVTYSAFYIIDDWKKELVIKDAIWASLYPQSIAVKNKDEVYIGITSGYVKLNPTTKQTTFYQYNK